MKHRRKSAINMKNKGENVMRSVDQKEFLGGQGTVHFDHVLEAEEMHGMNRVYAKVTLQ